MRSRLSWMAAISHHTSLAARGETPAAFGRRCIPTPTPTRCETRVGDPGADCVVPSLKYCLGRRANRRGPHGADCAPWGGSAGRLAALGATLDFHHGLVTKLRLKP